MTIQLLPFSTNKKHDGAKKCEKDREIKKKKYIICESLSTILGLASFQSIKRVSSG